MTVRRKENQGKLPRLSSLQFSLPHCSSFHPLVKIHHEANPPLQFRWISFQSDDPSASTRLPTNKSGAAGVNPFYVLAIVAGLVIIAVVAAAAKVIADKRKQKRK